MPALPTADVPDGARDARHAGATPRPGSRPAWASALPDGFDALEGAGPGRRARLAVARDAAAPLAAAGFGPDGGERLVASDLAGRRPLGALGGAGQRLLVRRYEHGGLLRTLTGRRFGDPERPFRELALAAALRARGFPTARVVAARARPAPGGGWWLDLVSERVEGASDLGEVLERARAGELAPDVRQRIACALGELLARAHALGLAHADLQPRNLLVRPARPARGQPVELVAIDLDRSSLADELEARARHRNLARLLRAARRRDGRGARFLTRTDLARVARAYARRLSSEPGVARAAASWREEARAVERAVASSLARHRLGWWLERVAGADPARRDGGARVRA